MIQFNIHGHSADLYISLREVWTADIAAKLFEQAAVKAPWYADAYYIISQIQIRTVPNSSRHVRQPGNME
jgi:hypothetical protein